jgi:hypothetical protein
MARTILAAVAVVLLCAASTQASRRNLQSDAQGRQLQAAESSNCTSVDRHCTLCWNQRVAGTRMSELLCFECESWYRLRRDGISKTCGEDSVTDTTHCRRMNGISSSSSWLNNQGLQRQQEHC